VREAARAILDCAVLVNPIESVNLVHGDEPDNRIIECAIAAGTDTIVTDDQHLLKLRSFRNTLIMTPREFLSST